MEDKIFIEMLESWIKELKIEMSEMGKCSNSLKTEVSNLKLLSNNFTNTKSELMEEIKSNKNDLLGAIKDFKDENSKSHDDINMRLRDLERKEASLTSIAITDKKELNTRIDTVVTNNKSIKSSITWMWRTIVAISLSIIYKYIQS